MEYLQLHQGRWRYRRRWPTDVVKLSDSSPTFIKSLGTSDKGQAKQRRATVELEFNAKVASLRRKLDAQPRELSVEEAVSLAGQWYRDAYNEMESDVRSVRLTEYQREERKELFGRYGEDGGPFDYGDSDSAKEAALKILADAGVAPGNNTILAQILYRGARFEPVSVEVNSMTDVSSGSTRNETKPRLFFLGVGISDYQEKDADLEYADKDVRVVSELLAAQQGSVFSEIRTLVLTDAQATKRDIEEKGIYEFLNYATENDVIVIYLAGHGAQHTNGELFLMTHDSDFSRPFSGFNMRMFADFLKGRPESQKAILFMDMCRAGTLQFFDRGARTTTLGGGTSQVTAEDVAVKLDGSGTVIFSSSSGAAPSYESGQWEGGHGAFTAAVLQALRGEADSGASGPNGFVDVLELQKYVIDKVPEITGSKNQQPKIIAAINVEPYALTAAE